MSIHCKLPSLGYSDTVTPNKLILSPKTKAFSLFLETSPQLKHRLHSSTQNLIFIFSITCVKCHSIPFSSQISVNLICMMTDQYLLLLHLFSYWQLACFLLFLAVSVLSLIQIVEKTDLALVTYNLA